MATTIEDARAIDPTVTDEEFAQIPEDTDPSNLPGAIGTLRGGGGEVPIDSSTLPLDDIPPGTPPGTPPIGGGDTMTTSEKEVEPDIEALRQEARNRDKAARDAAIKGQFGLLMGEAREQGIKGKGVVKGVGAQPGLAGFSTILQGELREVQKATDKNIADLTTRMNQAILQGDINAENRAMENLRLQWDIKDKIFQQEAQLRQMDYQDRQLDIDKRVADAQIAAGKIGIAQGELEIIDALGKGIEWTSPTTGKTYKGIADPTPETTSFEDDEGNITITNKATGKIIAVLKGVGKGTQMKSVDVNGKLFTFNPATGDFIDSGITVPKQTSSSGANQGELAAKSMDIFNSWIDGQGQFVDPGTEGSNPVRGTDGFVGIDTYRTVKEMWVTDGGDPGDFDDAFLQNVNPTDRNIFGLEGGPDSGSKTTITRPDGTVVTF